MGKTVAVPDTIPSPLRAVKRRAGDLELAVLHAAQVGERGVRAGRGPTRAELEEDQRLVDALVAHFEARRRLWSARALGPAALPCLACARLRGRAEADSCPEHAGSAPAEGTAP